MPFSGEPLEIGFNAEFLRDGLESVDTDEIALRLISPLRPGLLRSEDENFSYLIMPIRLAGWLGFQWLDRSFPTDDRQPTRPENGTASAPRRPDRPGSHASATTARTRRSSWSCPPGSCWQWAGTARARRICSRRSTSGRRASRREAGSDPQLVRFGAEAARIEVAGRGPALELEIEITLRPGRCDEGSRERRNPSRRRTAPLRGLDARVHARPSRRGQGRAGGPAGVLRPCSGAPLPGPGRRAGRIRRGRGATECRAARVAIGASSRDAVSPWTERVADLGSALVEARREAIALLAPLFAERALQARPPRRGRPPLRRRPADGRSARGSPRRRSRPRNDRPRAPPGRHRAFAPATGICAASARRASSASPCCR